MFQLDEQGDLYENTKKDLLLLRTKAEEYILQVGATNSVSLHVFF